MHSASTDGRRLEAQRESARQSAMELERMFAPLMRSLSDAGFQADSVNDFTSRYAPLPTAAVNILVSFIVRLTNDDAKEVIVRQLATAATPFDGRVLVACFEGTTGRSLRWAVLNTIACAMPHSIDGWLCEARRDAWIENTLRVIGGDVRGRKFDQYLDAAVRNASDDGRERNSAAKEPPYYAQVYGPVLRQLRDAGFDVHSLEELRECFAPVAPTAINILLESLMGFDDKAKLLILHVLDQAAERFDGRPLAACYDGTNDTLVKDNVLMAIALTSPHSIDEWLAALDPQTKKVLSALRYLK